MGMLRLLQLHSVHNATLSNISATMNPEQNGSYTISMTDGNQLPVSYSPVYGLYENVTNVLYAYGKAITILATPPILDANLDSGSTFNMTETRHSSNGLNDTEIVIIQAMTCVLSLTSQQATISASTSALLSVNPVSPPPNSTWLPWQINSTGNPDPQLDWFGSA